MLYGVSESFAHRASLRQGVSPLEAPCTIFRNREFSLLNRHLAIDVAILGRYCSYKNVLVCAEPYPLTSERPCTIPCPPLAVSRAVPGTRENSDIESELIYRRMCTFLLVMSLTYTQPALCQRVMVARIELVAQSL